jgi:hypothetical protein
VPNLVYDKRGGYNTEGFAGAYLIDSLFNDCVINLVFHLKRDFNHAAAIHLNVLSHNDSYNNDLPITDANLNHINNDHIPITNTHNNDFNHANPITDANHNHAAEVP